MTTAVAPRNGNGQPPATVVESVVIRGDLSKLSDADRINYYQAVCKSVGLNPLTKPFEYIMLNGKLTLYALRNCTDQLRAIHRISVADMTETERDGVYIVTCKVANASGRTDISKGAVNIAKLQGEALANALMKAETKAKRRATLSICGLSLLDETENEDIPTARKNPHVTVASDILPQVEYADSGEPIDNIPIGDGTIKPLPKKDTRDRFEAMQKEMRATKTPEELTAWGRDNRNRLQLFKDDWQAIMRGLYADHLEGLRTKAPSADDPPTDPEQFLKWADKLLAAVIDPGMLEQTWNYRIEPHIDGLLPPDQVEAQGIYRRHETRLAP